MQAAVIEEFNDSLSQRECVFSVLQVYLSSRSGAWLVGRVGEGGLPRDLVGTSRFDLALAGLLPTWSAKAFETKLNRAFNHSLYGLQPQHR